MFLTNESKHEYRFGDNGPKYLSKGPKQDFGIVIIQPEQDFDTHKHEHQEESFFVLEGECDLYIDGELIKLVKGDYIACEAGESHYFKNSSKNIFKAIFVKAPHLDYKDSVYMDWKPGKKFEK